MNFPDIPAGFFGPLLGSLDKIAAVASKTIPTVTDPRRRDLFAGLLDELQKSRAQFESLVIPEALETHRKLQESTSKSLELLEDHNALNDRMKEIRDEYAGTVAASKEFRQENPPKPLPPPAKPQWLPKKRSATALFSTEKPCVLSCLGCAIQPKRHFRGRTQLVTSGIIGSSATLVENHAHELPLP
ncbi:MAG: hypothetical protein EBS30_12980 [Planctomycetes bacterium]|nr:hypothetical protein [Planctomycetota bacterium]